MFPHKVPFLRANSLIMQIFNVLHVEFQIFSWLTKVALLWCNSQRVRRVGGVGNFTRTYPNQ